LVNSNVKSDDLSALIRDEMIKVEELMRSQADGRHSDLEMALRHLLSSGGKRIRPTVALLIGEMLGGDPQRLITLAAAIELLHTATLVHDDLIDGAILRRGIATLNSQWSPAATVLTGDFIFSRAAKLAAQTESVPVVLLFAETLTSIVNGEIVQLFARRGTVNREEYNQRIYSKTASLFELATTSPAMLSPVSEDVVETMRSFGNAIGMAFQIVDDVLDFTGEQVTVGKPVANDLRQGLITLPALYYLEDHPDDPDMGVVLRGGYASDENFSRLVSSIRQSGSIRRSMLDARAEVERAVRMLARFPDSPKRRALEDTARYIVDRDL
jgi:geranylgeranyl pyrophosphate synthase